MKHAHFFGKIAPDASPMERMVIDWFAHNHEVLWIPIIEVEGDSAEVRAQALADAEQFQPVLLTRLPQIFLLPAGIKGWLFPAHQDDTEVVAVHDGRGEVSFGALRHPHTGEVISFRYDTEADLRHLGLSAV